MHENTLAMNGNLTHGYMKKFVEVQKRLGTIVSDLTGGDTSTNDSNTCSSRSNIAERLLGGRPSGSTKKRQRREVEEVTKAKNEIAQRMMETREIVKSDNKV